MGWGVRTCNIVGTGFITPWCDWTLQVTEWYVVIVALRFPCGLGVGCPTESDSLCWFSLRTGGGHRHLLPSLFRYFALCVIVSTIDLDVSFEFHSFPDHVMRILLGGLLICILEEETMYHAPFLIVLLD